jgi:hypothetical protein
MLHSPQLSINKAQAATAQPLAGASCIKVTVPTAKAKLKAHPCCVSSWRPAEYCCARRFVWFRNRPYRPAKSDYKGAAAVAAGRAARHLLPILDILGRLLLH